MNSLTRIISYDKTKNVNQENCNCDECRNVKVENQVIKYPSLSEEEIEQIIYERYSDKDEKTKIFIRKALRVHGNRYDYSNVVYIKSKLNIEIICRVEGHDPFPQTPNNHLRGRGCNKCRYEKVSNSLKLNTKEFIERANKVHGEGTYDYSKVKYVNANTKVTIICHNHDIPYEFPQTPANHLLGKGCKLCTIKKLAENRKLILEEFIEKANEVHGFGTYDYSKSVYKGYKIPLTIICSKHGDFPQTPANHLQGRGCKKCQYEKLAEIKKSNIEEFIKKANKVHGEGTYDYSKVEYINNHTEVIIICSKHGEFLQTPQNHLNGQGCLLCSIEKLANERRLTKEEFIEKANKVHEGIYDYSKINYINMYTDVIIICPKHGEFPQKPSVHIYGKSSCPKCNKNKGEASVRRFLTEKGIEFEEQKTFEGCKNKRLLKFDFYLPKYNLCIESDGNVHSEKINWNGKMTDIQMEENLKSNQYRDDIKNEYCKKNGIGLLRVNNLRVDEELTEYFQNN